jgi:cell wall-associated NlpC family hydrolase
MKKLTIASGALIYLITVGVPSYCGTKGSVFSDHSRERIIKTAKRYLGVRYRYGGTSPFGFDCSGFVMFVFKKNGITLPREARGQYYKGKKISISKAKPGDLVFFRVRSRRRRRRISHVGIYIGNHRFIHSPSRGKRVSITSMNNRYWKRRYIGAVTFLKDMNHKVDNLNKFALKSSN